MRLSLNDQIKMKRALCWIGICLVALNGFLGSILLCAYIGMQMGMK